MSPRPHHFSANFQRILWLPRILLAVVFFLGGIQRQASGWETKVDNLRIGTSGALASATTPSKEKGALVSLKTLIKDETGLENDIIRQASWRELADKMAAGQVQVGVFQGYEFAWAHEIHPKLKPLALAINTQRYPVTYLVTNQDNKATDFAGLQGQSLALTSASPRFARFFLERKTKAEGKSPETYFSKMTTPENIEDALDDVVDGTVQVAVVDRAGLEGYKRRKPARFKQLKEVAHSEPILPVIIAYNEEALDKTTLERFRDGLVGANQKEKGKTMLTLFRLTAFETVPALFGQVLAETRKAFPPD